MSIFGSLLVIRGLVKEGILGKPVNTDSSKAVCYDMKEVAARSAASAPV
ncbi:hypothetical protein L195_g060666, partial [Trifolium pratense]